MYIYIYIDISKSFLFSFSLLKLHDFRLHIITYQESAKDMHHLDSEAGVVGFPHTGV